MPLLFLTYKNLVLICMYESKNLSRGVELALMLLRSCEFGDLYLPVLFPLQLLPASPTQMGKRFYSNVPLNNTIIKSTKGHYKWTITFKTKGRNIKKLWNNEKETWNDKSKECSKRVSKVKTKALFSSDSLDTRLLWARSYLTVAACLLSLCDDDRFIVTNFLRHLKQ